MNTQTTPEMVPEYTEAKNANLLPKVPTSPPVAGSISSMKLLLICIAIVFITGFAGIQIGNSVDLPTWVKGAMFIVPLLAAVGSFYFPSKAKTKEYAAGYTYVDDAVMTYGVPLSKLYKVQNQAGPAGHQWNFRGLWKLNYNGSANRPPVEGVLPIGYYPSPNRQGEFEYWTGAEWMGKFKTKAEIPDNGRLVP